ncbi:hypothetical protein [Streptomyces sp. ADI96-02]|uniref:hypothetical protein n=1 Tax=Streptomyces sp. ADI96-02 TaxID=1522760 RepID=UPI000F5590AC|nr:hypothetical protein [Streptomyces sp. ADI96-02]
MQRTRITVRLLVGVAATAVSGCVSVGPQAGSGQPGASSAPVQDVAPQIVQPPAREALERVVGPSRPAERPSPAVPPVRERTPAGRDAGQARPPAQREEADAPRRRTPHRMPRVPVDLLPALPHLSGVPADVCALGRGSGGWAAGSRAARICDETYDR